MGFFEGAEGNLLSEICSEICYQHYNWQQVWDLKVCISDLEFKIKHAIPESSDDTKLGKVANMWLGSNECGWDQTGWQSEHFIKICGFK